MNTISHLVAATFLVSFLVSAAAPALSSESPAASGKASKIVEVAGTACMAGGKTREATLSEAIAKAKKKGHEYVLSEIKETVPGKKGRDILKAYGEGTVRVVGDPAEKWLKDPRQGECCRVVATVEVIPRGKELTVKAPDSPAAVDAGEQLSVNVWTDKKNYKEGEKFKVFIKSNKSFYGTVVYQDASGQKVQLLPNPYRKENFFAGNTLYELPGPGDKYDLIVTPPLGGEKITVFASTSPVGDLNTQPAGQVYLVTGSQEQMASSTRSIRFEPRHDNPSAHNSAEFYEASTELVTVK